MLALRAGSRRLATTTPTAASATAKRLLNLQLQQPQRALLSTGGAPPRPPTSTQPPPRPSSAPAGGAGGKPTAAAPGAVPPPSAKGPAAARKEGLGLGTALGMVLLAGGTAVTGYYYVLADGKERAQIEAYVKQAKGMVGLAGEEGKGAVKAAEETAKEGKHKVGCGVGSDSCFVIGRPPTLTRMHMCTGGDVPARGEGGRGARQGRGQGPAPAGTQENEGGGGEGVGGMGLWLGKLCGRDWIACVWVDIRGFGPI